MAGSAPTLRFASALSAEDDPGEALDETLGELTDRMGAGPIDLVLVFASTPHRNRLSQIGDRIQRELQPRVSLGATAGGVLAGGFELEQGPGLAVLAGRLEGAWLHPFSYQDLDWAAGEEDPAALRRGLIGSDDPAAADPAAVLLLADPFSTPMGKLLPAINRALPGVPTVGGMASAASQSGDNGLLLNGRVLDEGAVGVAIGGRHIRVDCTVSQGCRPIGEPWVITRARHNLIQEVGGQPIMDAVQQTAREAESEDRALVQEHGLLVGRVINEYKSRFGRGDFLIRNILGADQDTGYIAVSDLMRIGQTIQFHVRDRHTAEEDLRLLLQNQKLHGPASGALLCTCNGRGQRLFHQPALESSLVREAIGHAPLAGFFASGEVGPVGDVNFLHGFTASLAVFRSVDAETDAPADPFDQV
jgi:small ligand-binding sensory domain FIST